MNWIKALAFLFMMVGPAAAMEIDADPRKLISFLDKSLSPEFDILRITTDISADNHLIFRVKTRGEHTDRKNNDYLVLQILHEKAYLLLVPLNKEKGGKVMVFEGTLQPENHNLSGINEKFRKSSLFPGFNAKHIFRGAEFSVPLEWINYGADFGYDAYTVQANIQGNTLQIDKVYDQARKESNREKVFSAITLLNKICSPKR